MNHFSETLLANTMTGESLSDDEFSLILNELQSFLEEINFSIIAETYPQIVERNYITEIQQVDNLYELYQIYLEMMAFMDIMNQNLSLSLRYLYYSLLLLFIIFVGIIIAIEIQYYRNILTYRNRKEMDRDLILILDQERNNIALELHDDVAQRLGLVRQHLLTLDDDEAKEISLRNITEAIRTVRSLSGSMRGPKEMSISFQEQLQVLFSDFTSLSSIQLSYGFWNMEDLIIEDDEKLQIYRIMQELLSNVLRHSGAERVRIYCSFDKPELTIKYSDDGWGTDLILKSVQYRVRILGGAMTQSRGTNGGFRVFLSIPILI